MSGLVELFVFLEFGHQIFRLEREYVNVDELAGHVAVDVVETDGVVAWETEKHSNQPEQPRTMAK